jgi:hypothetical protein
MGIGGSISLITNQAEDPVVSDWARRTTLAGGNISIVTRTAHDKFVKSCKSSGIWTKMSSGLIMPFASDTYAGSLIPLIAPTGSAFTPVLITASDYSLSGGFDFGSGNVDPKRIETNINAQTIFQSESAQVSVYRPIYRVGRDSVANTINGDDVQNRLQWHCNYETGSNELDLFDYNTSIGRVTASGITPTGLMTGSRLNSVINIYKNAVSQASSTLSSSPVPNATVNLLGCLNNVVNLYSRSTSTYLYLGLALTTAEEIIHRDIVQSLQASLGRAV